MTFKVIFLHPNGEIKTFLSTPNHYTNAQMYTFDNWRTCYSSNVRNVKLIIKNIEKMAIKIIETKITNNKEEELSWHREI